MATTPTSGLGPSTVTQMISAPVLRMEAKIRALTAEEIFLVSATIATRIVNQLGPLRTARMNVQVIKAKGQTQELITRGLHAKIVADNLTEYKSKPFLSDEKAGQLCLMITQRLQTQMARTFSVPQQFLESGINFCLTDNDPRPLLKEAAAKVGLDLDITNVAFKWHFDLQIDLELTQQKSDLVFVLLETSAGVEISKRSFTLRELKL